MATDAKSSATQLSPYEAAAIKLLAKDLEDRARMVPGGTHGQKIDLVLHVIGMLNKGEDGESTRTSKPKPEEIVGWILSKIGADGRRRLFDKFAAEVKTGSGIPEVADAEARTMAATMIQTASTTGKYPRSGALRGSVTLKAVDMAALKPSVAKAVEEATRSFSFEIDEPVEEDNE